MAVAPFKAIGALLLFFQHPVPGLPQRHARRRTATPR